MGCPIEIPLPPNLEPSCDCGPLQVPGYNDIHDARYCKRCRCWLENRCSTPGCPDCADRPPRAPE